MPRYALGTPLASAATCVLISLPITRSGPKSAIAACWAGSAASPWIRVKISATT